MRCAIAYFFVMIIFAACKLGDDKIKKEYAVGTEKGYELAKYHCANCHSFVPANVLDRNTWTEYVLPDMAEKLGIEVVWKKHYVETGGNGAQLAYGDWMKIVDYYTKSAPEKIILPEPAVPVKDSSLFVIKTPGVRFDKPVKTVLTVVDTVTGSIYTGDGLTDYLYKWDHKLKLIDSVQLYSPPVNAFFYNNDNGKREAVVTTMGTMQALDVLNGKVLKFDVSGKFKEAIDTIAIRLPRSIQTVAADFDNDGITDWLTCGFGQARGGLYWFKKSPAGYLKKAIKEVPGATQAIVKDFNKDGWQDVMVLFAYDSESIRLFTNNKNGSFTETTILSFPPVNGSTSFQLADFNNDGLDDILYSCGDNADVSQVLKPFHGVYIYINKGNNNFQQSYFYYINGCTKAVAADLDLDGDLDIATIAFYADFKKNPAEKFLYLRQDKYLQFQSLSPSIEKNGRWLTMDVNDYDHDGDPDIILGNFAKGFFIDKNFNPDWNLYSPITVLENKTRNK